MLYDLDTLTARFNKHYFFKRRSKFYHFYLLLVLEMYLELDIIDNV